MSLLKSKNSFSYEQLTSRNYGFISSELQNKIKSCRLLFAGCGLASVLAEAAVRLGFENLILLDHDYVELSNLNRQNYSLSDITHNKAESLSRKLLLINPDLQLRVAPEAIKSPEQILDLLKEADVIINTIDYGKLYFDLVELARGANKLVICPFNPCDSGMAVFFTKQSHSIYEFLQSDIPLLGLNFPVRLRELYTPSQLPLQLQEKLDNLIPIIEGKGYYPQLVIGAHITTAIVINYLVKYLNEEHVPIAPQLIYCEV